MLKPYRKTWTRALCILFALLIVSPLSLISVLPADELCIVGDVPGGTCHTTSSSMAKPIYEIDNGDTLAEVAANLRKQEFESVLGFSHQGEKLFNYTSNLRSHAYITSTQFYEFLENDGRLFIHNHPSSCGFSAQDLYVEAKYQAPCAMVISDVYIYLIAAGESGWGKPEELRDYYQARYDAYLTEAIDYISTLKVSRRDALAAPVTPDDGSLAWFCQDEIRQCLTNNPDGDVVIRTGLWVTHRALLDAAARFDLIYSRTPSDSFNFDDARLFDG